MRGYLTRARTTHFSPIQSQTNRDRETFQWPTPAPRATLHTTPESLRLFKKGPMVLKSCVWAAGVARQIMAQEGLVTALGKAAVFPPFRDPPPHPHTQSGLGVPRHMTNTSVPEVNQRTVCGCGELCVCSDVVRFSK